MMRFPVTFAPLAALLLLAQPARATLVLSSEAPVTDSQLDTAPFDQTNARLATDGSSFLAVWVDHSLTGAGDIHASRVDGAGARADDDPLPVAKTDADEDHPAVAWGTERYLVTWSSPGMVQARLIAPDRAMSAVIDIEAVDRLTEPKVAFNGRVFLVVWSGPGLRYRGAIVDPDGSVVRRFDAGSAEHNWPEIDLVAARGAFHLVTAVTDFNGSPNANGYPADVGYTPFDENGTAAARVVAVPAQTPVFDLRAAAGAGDFLIAWTTARGIAGAQIRDVRVTAGGPGEVESLGAEMMYVQDVVADGSDFLLLFGDERSKLLRRAGTPAQTAIATPSDLSTILDAASANGQTVFVIRLLGRIGLEFGPAGGDLYLSRLDAPADQPLAIAPHHQSSPDIAGDDEVRLAVWCEYLAAGRRLGVVAARVTAFGSALTEGIDLGANVYHPAAPRVAASPEGWLVVWAEAKQVYGARVSRDGTPMQAAPFIIAGDVFESTEVDVTWDGASYVVIFCRGQFIRGLRTTVRALRVSTGGAVDPAEVTLSEEMGNEFPAVASGGEGALAVWRGGVQLRGAMLSRSNTVTPVVFPITLAALPRPAVAWNGATFLVASPFSGASGAEIEWMLVSSTAVVSLPTASSLAIGTGPGTYGYPTVALDADGDRFVLAFNGVAPDRDARSAVVYAAMIDGAGRLAQPPVPAASTIVEFTPAMAVSGRTIIYARKIGHLTRELSRVFTREIREETRQARRRSVRK